MWTVYAVLAALLWGLDYSVDERVLQKRVSVLTLLGLQMATATAVILPLAFARGTPRELKLAWEDRGLHWQLPLAVAVFTVGNLFIALSIQRGTRRSRPSSRSRTRWRSSSSPGPCSGNSI
jgi:drug/metabolite transporter (DMT)-like permease